MLTKRQKQIFEYLKKFIKDKGYSPTLEEIGKHFRRPAKSGIHEHLKALEEKGYIRKSKNKARSIEVSEAKKPSGLTSIPLLGNIAAGEPIEPIENPLPFQVPKNMLLKTGRHYALKVQGNSMANKDGIFDGDIVIVHEQQMVEVGETGVAYLPEKNEVTLKKIYPEKNRVRLQPANPNFRPFYENNVEIQGKVVGVLRKYG